MTSDDDFSNASSSAAQALPPMPESLRNIISLVSHRPGARLFTLREALVPICGAINTYQNPSIERILIIWRAFRGSKVPAAFQGILGEDLLALAALMDEIIYPILAHLVRQPTPIRDFYAKAALDAINNCSANAQDSLEKRLATIAETDLIKCPGNLSDDVRALSGLSCQYDSAPAFRRLSQFFIAYTKASNPIKQIEVVVREFEKYCQFIEQYVSYQPLIYFQLFQVQMLYLMRKNSVDATVLITKYLQGQEVDELHPAVKTFRALMKCEWRGELLQGMMETLQKEVADFFDYVSNWALSRMALQQTNCGRELRKVCP